MGLKNLHIKLRKKIGLKYLRTKLKGFRLRRFLIGDSRKGKKGLNYGNKASWMAPVSHGYHVVGKRSTENESNDKFNSNSVVVQREQIEELEVWFFGVSDESIGEYVTKYMQVHLFDKKPKKSQFRKKSKETMRRAYLGAKSKVKEADKPEEMHTVGSASAVVISGEKLVIANMGDYKAVVCRNGNAYQINRKRQQDASGRHWSQKFLQGVLRMPKACEGNAKPFKDFDFAVGDENIDWYTEFVILASTGIWEVMKHQEAVNLIRHIEDPQEAAECLAKEAITRMSRSSISCLVFRFE